MSPAVSPAASPAPASARQSSIAEQVERLSTVSRLRFVEPDTDLPGAVAAGQVMSEDLLSVAGLGLELSAEQWARLSREEVGAILEEGLRLEAILTAGFGLYLAGADDFTDPRLTYLLHEVGEETRHSRLFMRVLSQLRPRARNPLERGVLGFLKHTAIRFAIRRPVLFFTLVLAGEEIPDLIQKRAEEHPDTDPFLKTVHRYHRQEEARHLSYARMLLCELWPQSPRRHRWLVRHVAPWLIRFMFEGLVHPGVYRTVGLPGWGTWQRANRSPARLELRHASTRPVVEALERAGVFGRGGPNQAWRALAGL